jgi:hypothetical protein
MTMLDEEEKELYKDLQGDDDSVDEDNPFAELSQMKSKMDGIHAGNVKKRFKAWQTLFLAAAMAECPVFLTTSPDGGDLLLAMYEKKTAQPAPLAAEFALPAFVGWNSVEAGQMVRDFSVKNGDLLARLEGALAKLTGRADATMSEEKSCRDLRSLTGPWEEALAADFPAARFGRITARLYLLPKVSGSALLGKAQPALAEPVNGLLAVVG